MNNKKILESHRLTLIASTLAHLRTEFESPQQLASLLNAAVSPEWPTGEYDRDAMEFFRARLEEGGEAVEGWYGWYAVRSADREGPRALVGGAGYFGPPDCGWHGRGWLFRSSRMAAPRIRQRNGPDASRPCLSPSPA